MKKYIVSILIFVLVSIFSTAVLAQGKGNKRGNANSNNQPMKPCDQLTGDDLLVKGRKCTLSNGQVTTIGAYQKSQNQNSGSGQNRGRNQMGGLADAKAPHRNDSLTYENVEWCNKMNDDAGIAKNRQCKSPNGQVTTVGQYCQSNPSAKGCNQGNNRNRQTGNSDSLISEIGLPAAKGNRKNQNANGQNQVTGGTIPVYATDSDNTTTQGNSVSQAPNNSRTRPRGKRNQRNTPANTNGEANPENRETSVSTSQGKTNNGGLQETQYDFVYPTKPEAIVTWHEDSSYGYTTANSGWEFIHTNAGIAVRRRNEDGTVVAHTKCNDTANYTFGYGGNGGSIDMIMCRPLRDGLPRLKPSIMIVPKGQ